MLIYTVYYTIAYKYSVYIAVTVLPCGTLSELCSLHDVYCTSTQYC